MPRSRRFQTLGDGPSDPPAVYVDPYGNPVAAPIFYDAEAGGSAQQEFYAQPLPWRPDSEAGGLANQPPDLSPAAAASGGIVLYTPEQLQAIYTEPTVTFENQDVIADAVSPLNPTSPIVATPAVPPPLAFIPGGSTAPGGAYIPDDSQMQPQPTQSNAALLIALAGIAAAMLGA